MSGRWLVPAAGLLALAIILTAARCGTHADEGDQT
ncbi:hypothetical protein BX265_6155 [Streptomyces sp. TLI_235]|nr:hypothetical protein BX265_6155 [Streptomyces sp. TLI_235]